MKSVRLSWDAVINDTQGDALPQPPTYKVYAVNSASNFTTTPVATVSDTTASITMGTVGSYKARVTAVSPDGEGPASAEVTFASVLQVPAAPTNLRVGA